MGQYETNRQKEINSLKKELFLKLDKYAKARNYDKPPKTDAERIDRLQNIENYLKELDDRSGNKYSKVSEGRTIVPYSNAYGNLYAYEVADAVMDGSDSYSYVSDTAIGTLINDKNFKQQFGEYLGYDFSEKTQTPFVNNFLWGTTEANGHKSPSPVLDSSGNAVKTSVPSLVDFVSERVMKEEIGNAKGDVFALVSNSENRNVFVRTELPELLKNRKVTAINGIPKIELEKIYTEKTKALTGKKPLEDAKYESLEACAKIIGKEADKILDDVDVQVKESDRINLDMSRSSYFKGKTKQREWKDSKKSPFHEYVMYANEIKERLKNGAVKVVAKEKVDNLTGGVKSGIKYGDNITDVRTEIVLKYADNEKIEQRHKGDFGESKFNKSIQEFEKELENRGVSNRKEFVQAYKTICAREKKICTLNEIETIGKSNTNPRIKTEVEKITTACNPTKNLCVENEKPKINEKDKQEGQRIGLKTRIEQANKKIEGTQKIDNIKKIDNREI